MAMNSTYIIAELANAHQGDAETLYKLITAASDAGANGVKVQWFKYDCLATPDYEWYPAYVELFLPSEVWLTALDLAANVGLDVWADIFDEWGLEFAKEVKSKLKGVKLPPTVLEDEKLCTSIMKLGLPTLIGIGGWNEEQINSRLRVLKRMACNQLVIMHGFQGYPTLLADCNLSRIRHYLSTYKCRLGIADHADGATAEAIDIPAYAVCIGATVVEKHLTLDRSAKGYDYYSSLEPDAFAAMVGRIRRAELVLGGMERSENERNYLSAVPRAILHREICDGGLVRLDDVVFRRTGSQAALTPSEFKAQLPAVIRPGVGTGSPITASDLRPPKVLVVVICRLKSTRLKRKALAKIGNAASLLRCLKQCKKSKLANEVILATSHLADDDELVAVADQAAVPIVRGDPDSVLDRLIFSAEMADADVVVRVTGDCPVVSPDVIDFLIARHLADAADYTALSGTFPVGIAGDVFSTPALRRLKNSDADLCLTEYLRYYFEWNDRIFKCSRPKPRACWRGSYRLTLDVPEDLKMFNCLFDALASDEGEPSIADIFDILGKHPEIGAINAHVPLVYKADQDLVARLRKAVKISLPNLNANAGN